VFFGFFGLKISERERQILPKKTYLSFAVRKNFILGK